MITRPLLGRGSFKFGAALAGLASAAVASPTSAQSNTAGPTLPAERLVPAFSQHDKPSPYPVLPMFWLGSAPGEMPYRQDHVRPEPGVLGPVLDSARPFRFGAGYSGAGDAKEMFAQGVRRTANHMVMGTVGVETAGGYDDGDGNRIRFGYDRHTEQLVFGYLPAGRALKAVMVHDRIDDAVLPLAAPTVQNGVALIGGYGADPVKTERYVAKLSYEDKVTFAAADQVRVELGYVGLDRVANNFALRPTPAPNRMKGTPSADILSGTASVDFRAAGLAHRLGVDAKRTAQDGERLGGPGVNSLTTVTGRQYPGVRLLETGLFGETAHDLSADRHLTVGWRYDYVDASAGKADEAMRIGNFSGTPRDLYRLYSGSGETDAREHNLSARLKFEQEFLDDRARAFAAVGRIMRTADPTERYFALPSTAGASPVGTASRQVGNPGLDPEAHYRLDIGGGIDGPGWVEWGHKGPGEGRWLTSDAWRLAVTGHVDRVIDFISRDRAHGQAGVLQSDNAFIWRNVDALLAGLEVDVQWNLTRNWSTRLNLAYQWGENTSDGRPLYGINPLEANWIVDYHDMLGTEGTWHVGGKLRAVARQGRADNDPSRGSGYDPAETAGYAVLDLFAAAQLRDRIGVRVGIDNLLDKRYSDHNPHTSTDEPNPSPVSAPGRTFYLRTVANF